MISASKEPTMNSMKNTMEHGKETVRDAALEVRDDVYSIANNAGRKLRSTFNSAADEVAHASDAVVSQIRTNPVQSSLIALGAGLLLGALLRR